MKLANSRWRAGTRCALIAAACAASAALATCAQAPVVWSSIEAGPIAAVAFDDGNDAPASAFTLRLSAAGKGGAPAARSASYAGDVLFTSAAVCDVEPDVEPDVAELSLETELVALAQDVLAPDATISPGDYQLNRLSYRGLDYAGSGGHSHAYAALGNSPAPGGYAPDDSGHSPNTDVALNPQLGSGAGISPPNEQETIVQYDPLLPPLGPADGGEILPDLFLPEIESLNLAAGESGDSPSALAAVPEPASLLTWSLLLGCGLYSARRLRK